MELWSSVGFFFLLVSMRVSRAEYDPSPNPGSVVEVGQQARFTVLTPHLVRMEWGGKRDLATLAFVNRNLPVPKYSTRSEGQWSIIETSALMIRYLPNNVTFNAHNLMVLLKAGSTPQAFWTPQPGILDIKQRLPGTLRSLDGRNGAVELNCYKHTNPDEFCELGVISRDGYVVIDDSNRPTLDGDKEWSWVLNNSATPPDLDTCTAIPPEMRQECGYLNIAMFDCSGISACCYDNSTALDIPSCYYTTTSYRDLYFFGHGHDYYSALQDFTKVSGAIPMPPRYVFGVFYSRYHAYNDPGFTEVLSEFAEHEVPLDVLVMDMDWHITFYDGTKDSAGEAKGWTGYTWDRHLFPYPEEFLSRVHQDGLKVTLNIHAASGIQNWEDTYKAMAEAMGVDSSTEAAVPFTPADKKFVTNWMKIVMHKRESEGVDFWWLDWSEGNDGWTNISRVNPTIWQNYIFYTDPYHWTNKLRPFILHRWGGLGNHRYQGGFTGDVVWSWDSLTFQVFFTLSASNVGHGFLSNDIGAHLSPDGARLGGELYTRWMQWGTFSPIFRPHSDKNGKDFRRIWKYSDEFYEPMRQAILLRQALVPYIYTAAHVAYAEGISLVRPMYYEFPENDKAYIFLTQYNFGDQIIASPITEAIDSVTKVATKGIWIPEGCYLSWFGGELFQGDQVYVKNFTLDEIPIFVKCGSIIPLRVQDSTKLFGSAQEIPEVLRLMVFHGNSESGSGSLYEDDGNSTLYQDGAYATTKFYYQLNKTKHLLELTIDVAEGDGYPQQPKERSYQICIANFAPASSVTVTQGGKEVTLPYISLQKEFRHYLNDSWTYDGSQQELIINLVTKKSVTEKVEVRVDYSSYSSYNPFPLPGDGLPSKLRRLQTAKEILDAQFNYDTVRQSDFTKLLDATILGTKITYHPENVIQLSSFLDANYLQAVIEEVSRLNLYDNVKQEVLALLY